MNQNKFSDDLQKRASKFFQKEWHDLTELEKSVLASIVEKRRISRNINKIDDGDNSTASRH